MNGNDKILHAAPSNIPFEKKVIRGLLWQELLICGRMLAVFLAFLLVGGWMCMVFSHPGFIIAWGILFAFTAALVLGGRDMLTGCEEFICALPPKRTTRFWIRLLLGGTTVLAGSTFGVLSIALDLPQIFWGLVVETGFADPFFPCEQKFLYALAVILPTTLFTVAHCLNSLAQSKLTAIGLHLFSVVIVVLVALIGLYLEYRQWEDFNGLYIIPMLVAVIPISILVALNKISKKEGVARVDAKNKWAPFAVIFLGVLAIIGVGLLLVAGKSPGTHSWRDQLKKVKAEEDHKRFYMEQEHRYKELEQLKDEQEIRLDQRLKEEKLKNEPAINKGE